MKKLKLVLYALLPSILCVGCSVEPVRAERLPSLDKIDHTDLKHLQIDSALSIFGIPDSRDYVDKNKKQEALVYLNEENPRSTKLALIFDSSTKALVQANWFVNEQEPESVLSKVLKRYPKENFNFKQPTVIQQGLFGQPLNQYQSTSGVLQIFVATDSNRVSALRWTTGESLPSERRKPTSH